MACKVQTVQACNLLVNSPASIQHRGVRNQLRVNNFKRLCINENFSINEAKNYMAPILVLNTSIYPNCGAVAMTLVVVKRCRTGTHLIETAVVRARMHQFLLYLLVVSWPNAQLPPMWRLPGMSLGWQRLCCPPSSSQMRRVSAFGSCAWRTSS